MEGVTHQLDPNTDAYIEKKLELELKAARSPPRTIQENQQELLKIQHRLEIATRQLIDLQSTKNRDVGFLPNGIYADLPQAKLMSQIQQEIKDHQRAVQQREQAQLLIMKG